MEFDSNAIQMELKYCERCGGLWLRLRGSDLVYCPPCAVALAGLARDPRFPHRGRSCRDDDQPEITTAFWTEGGNA